MSLKFPGSRLNRVWESTLREISNGTAQSHRDVFMEETLKKAFTEVLKPKIERAEPIMGSVLDPVWLFPIGPLELRKRKLFRGELTACSLHLHNLKNVQIDSVEVQRSLNLDSKAVKIVAHVPIVWMTGNYSLKKALLFGFLPSGSTSGSFNIDLKSVHIGMVASLKISPNQTVSLQRFKVRFHWRDSEMKFDTRWKKLDKISDLLLNKMEMGDLILLRKRALIAKEIETYAHGLFNCILHNSYEGPDDCMVEWWTSQGWIFPWEYPSCS